MSDQQLMKLREERQALANELQLRQSAMKPQDAASSIVGYIAKGEEPKENEWVVATNGPQCCSIQ